MKSEFKTQLLTVLGCTAVVLSVAYPVFKAQLDSRSQWKAKYEARLTEIKKQEEKDKEVGEWIGRLEALKNK